MEKKKVLLRDLIRSSFWLLFLFVIYLLDFLNGDS